jgi:uncharacterized membrane-anchored protein
MKKEYWGLVLVIGLLLTVLGSYVLYNSWPLLTGKEIVLATNPVDPFNPLMGQYMQINYQISLISLEDNFLGLKEGDSVYVILTKDDNNIWRPDGISRDKPKKGDFIKGKIKSSGGDQARIEYGIEQFYFERHATMETNNVTVKVKVADSGRAKLFQLLNNGKPIEIEREKISIKS